jgi:serine/threonine-protein kinase
MSDAAAFAGFPLLEPLGPCPGGTAFRTATPGGRPAVLRKLDSDAVGEPAAFAERVAKARAVEHPHLGRLLDAGVADGVPWAVAEPPAGATLDALLADIGPMPADLAAGFAAQVAGALAAAHAAGLAHGCVAAGRVTVAPLEPMGKTAPDGSPRLRPAAGAAATLHDLGLTPGGTVAGDLHALGELAYVLLVGHRPSAADPPLAALRPDAPAELVAAVNELLLADPDARPPAATAADRLVPPAVVAVKPAPAGRRALYLWLAVGAALNLLGIALVVYALTR